MANGSESCREFAVSTMEAASTGFGAQFVIGFIQMADGQHDSIHAQTEIYPGRRLAPVLETRVYES